MATRISAGTGNFTTAGTWKAVSAVANAEVDSDANSINLSTGNSDSTAFVLAATNVDAIAVKFARPTTPTGTVTVTLRNSTAGSDAATVTINASDLAINGADDLGWYVFSFSPVTPNGTDSYLIRVTRSVADNVSNRIPIRCTTAAAADMSRMVRLVTTGAPAAGERIVVAGEWTAAATFTAYTVTMDDTSSTSYGSTTPPQSFSICNKGTLTYGTSASTNYALHVRGIMQVFSGGTLNIGAVGTPMPSSSTAVLEFGASGGANVDSGLRVCGGGTLVAQGNSVATIATLLTADAAASATTLTVGSTNGWAAGDVLAIASTTRTAAECENRTINTVASGTSVTLTAGLTNAHSGTSPTQGEVGNITRNVKIRGVSTTVQGYLLFDDTSTVDCDYVEFYWLGSNTSNKRGINVSTTTGSCSITYCALHDFTVANSLAFLITSAAADNITFSYNVSYLHAISHFSIAATSGTNITVDHNLFIRSTASMPTVILLDVGLTFTNNTIVGNAGNTANSPALLISEAASIGLISGNTMHSNAEPGITLNACQGTISNTTIWRTNNNGGMYVSVFGGDVTFDGLTMFGSGLANIVVGDESSGTITINNGVIDSGTTLTAPIGIRFDAGLGLLCLNSCTFGATTTHATADLSVTNFGTTVRGRFNNCLFASSTELANQTNLSSGSYLGSSRNDQTNGNHKAWKPYGTISIDTTLYHSASPSARLAPNNASNKLTGGVRQVAVASGTTLTPAVWVRESVSGDGTAYNGSRARLIVKRNDSLGITADAVLATATSGSTGAWQQITGTTVSVSDNGVLEFVVDCDGTAGWINVDDWTVTGDGYPVGDQKYWLNGFPITSLVRDWHASDFGLTPPVLKRGVVIDDVTGTLQTDFAS